MIGDASFIFHYSWSHQGHLLSSLARGGLGVYLVSSLWSRARTQMNKRRSWRNIEMLLLWEFEFCFGQKRQSELGRDLEFNPSNIWRGHSKELAVGSGKWRRQHASS